jgi:YD repeat-containing protein
VDVKQPQVVLLALLVAAQAHARLPIEALQREIQLRHVHTSQAADIGGNKVFLVKQPRNEAHRLVWASTTCSKVPPAYPPDFFYGSTLLPEEEVFLTQDVLDKLDGSQLWTYYLLPGVEHQYSPIDRPDFLDTPCTTNNCEAQFEAAQAFVASLNTVRSHPSIATAGGPLWHYIYELPALATQLEIHVTNYVKLLDEAYGGAGFGRFPSSEYYPHPMFTGFLWEYYEWESAQDWVDYCTYFGVECDEPTPGARYYTQVVYHQSIAFSQPDFDDATIRSLGADVFIHIDAIDAEACRPSGFAPEDMGRLLFFARVNRGEQSGWIETSRPDVPTLPRSVELGGHQGLGWSLYTNASYTVVTLDYRPLPDTGDSCMGCEDQPGGAHSDLASMHVTIGLGRDAIHPSVGVLELGARDAQEGIAALSRVRFHAVSDSAQAVLTNDRLDSVTAPQCHVRFTELPAPNAEHGFVAHFHMRSAESDPFESESRRALVVVQGMEDESIAEAWAAGDFSNPGEYWDDSVHIYEMCYGAVAKHTVFGIPYSTRPSPGTATAPPAADQHRLLVKRTTDTVPRLFSTDPPGLELPAVVKSASAAQTTESSDDTSFWVVSVGNAHGTFSQSYRREVSGETLNILRTKEDHSQAAEITEEIHTNMAWGWALVRSTSSPWDNPVWTEYTYYTNSTDHGYAQLNSILQSDGYWERYEYDAQGNLHKRIIPFGDAPPDAKEHLCRVRTTTTSHAGEELTTLEVEEVLGAEVARSYTIRSPRQTRHIQCASPGAGPAAPGNLVTTTTYEQDPRNPSPLTGLRVARIEHPDGTLTIKSYPDDGTEIVRHGEADATRTDVVDGRLTEVHRNDLGHVMSRQVIDIASGLLIESEVATDVDETGRPIAWSHLDGTTRRIDPGCCCGTESETARDGSTRFFTHDAEGRPVATRYSNAHGGTVIERTFYDGAGRATLRGYSDVAGMALQPGDTEFHAHFFPTERTGYDAAGRTRWTENSVGGRTVHDLPQTLGRHQMLATILPGGGTVEEEYQLDGQLFRRTGTAAPHLQMAYGVEGGELFAQTIHLGDRGETTLWSKTFTDFLGRPYRTVYSDGSFEQTWFNEKGQEVRSVDRDGIETLHAYNGKGESQVVALDENRNGVMDYAGRDRITRTTARVVSAHGTTVRRTTVETWDQDGSDASWTSLVQDVSVDGLRIWTRTDGLETQTTTAYEPEAPRRTDTTTHPDMTRLVTTTVNGQMSRQDWTDQQGQLLRRIDYDYGAFGDLVRQADTQAGIVEQVYATPHLMTSRVRRNRIDSNDVLAVSYGYDESLRLVATTNADQSVTRCEFGPDGQIRRCHGAGIHPLEYEYDVQGRLVALRTWQDFAAGSGAATTRWIHDPLSGHLARKEYEGGKGVDYAHTPGGRIKTRTWARGVTTAYGYDTLGQLTNVHHGTSDTPDTTYTYDRLGRLRSASSGHATNTYEYAGNLLVRETVAIEGLTHTLTHEYDALNRPAGHAGDTVPRLDYGYDHAGRLASVAFLGLTNTYLFGENGWPAESGVAGHLTVTRVYDGYDRLVAVSNSSPTATLPGFDYGHDLLGRRTKQGMARRDDGRELVWNYAYDAIGQLTGAWQVADGVDVPGRRYGYAYDDIGNRTRTSRSGGSPAPGHEGAADVVSTYTVNPLNQYVARTVPSSAEISGTARADAILSFENVHTGRRMRALRNGSWFHVDMPLGDNAMQAPSPISCG